MFASERFKENTYHFTSTPLYVPFKIWLFRDSTLKINESFLLKNVSFNAS